GPAAAEAAEAAPDPADINGPHFDPEVFLNKVRSECPLGQLLAREAALGREIRALDSDMQTLLYENYNKFISATGECPRGAGHGGPGRAGTQASGCFSPDTIRKMKVDFRRMEAEMDDLAANMAAISTSSARVSAALQDRHRRGAQLAGVQALLRKLQSLVEVPGRLRRWAAPGAEPARALRCHARARAVLRHYRHLPSFRAIEDESHAIMAELAQRLRARLRDETLEPKELSECVEMLLQLEEPPEELCQEFLSHAGTRLEAELAALEAELPPAEPPSGTAATPPPASDILDFVDRGSSSFVGTLCLLATSYRSLFQGHPGAGNGRLESFAAALTNRYFQLLERRLALERGLGDTSLLGEFCVAAVREGLVVAFLRWLCRTARAFAESPPERGAPAAPPALLLLLARLCLDYEATTISYVLTLTDEQFPPQDGDPAVTPAAELCAEARAAAQRLLDHYVQVQGAAVAQMLRKSVETRDWLGTVEPRNVRAVMKRVVEDITAIDVQVGTGGSPSPPGRPTCPWRGPEGPEGIPEITIRSLRPAEVPRGSLCGYLKSLTGLKTLLECVRLRTLGRFGLQQVQVDGHYLQLYLWRFAADERVVQGLLDEVAASAAHRCLDPVPMEHSVVELICERG
ncbi:VPS51 protein, partial [Columbina picui]|nr:VPS51 protein [Columbina picui]